jgi:outer membrane protein assembly factor BamD (BamD/ComL family)
LNEGKKARNEFKELKQKRKETKKSIKKMVMKTRSKGKGNKNEQAFFSMNRFVALSHWHDVSRVSR